MKFTKTKTEHHILPEFHKILLEIEKHPLIFRIIPGRIARQQKGSSDLRFKVSYTTKSGLKCIMAKGATAQEVFIVCDKQDIQAVTNYIQNITTTE